MQLVLTNKSNVRLRTLFRPTKARSRLNTYHISHLLSFLLGQNLYLDVGVVELASYL